MLGIASGDDPDGLISFSAEEKALLGAVVFGAAGIVVGTVVGALRGSRDIFRFAPDSPAPSDVNSSAGSAVIEPTVRLSAGRDSLPEYAEERIVLPEVDRSVRPFADEHEVPLGHDEEVIVVVPGEREGGRRRIRP